MLFLQFPKKKLTKLADIIKNNTPAYEKAIAAVKLPLDKLLDRFPHGEYRCGSLHEASDITPTLIYPAVELVSENKAAAHSYIGLYTHDIYELQKKSKSTQKHLLSLLKALSDNSKFDILLSLLKSQKYNLELAEELNLSAATVSHHMNVLLACRLVNVDKKYGRVYYSVSKDTIENLILELQSRFLG